MATGIEGKAAGHDIIDAIRRLGQGVDLAPGMPVTDEQLLVEYLGEAREARESEVLCELIWERAAGQVRRRVQRRLRGAQAEDREDVVSAVLCGLLGRLVEMKRAGGEAGIQNYRAYVARAAQTGCDQFLRTRYPLRHRLKNRVRYLLDKFERFASWDDGEGTLVCGLRRWEGSAAEVVPADWGQGVTAGESEPAKVLEQLFAAAGHAVELDELVGVLAVLWGVQDRMTSLEMTTDEPAAEAAEPERVLDEKRRFGELWKEVRALPLGQRRALLLNLRDPEGGSALEWLPVTGITTIGEIGELLEFGREELGEMWGRLPLEDAEIALKLGLTRQQVINLRLAARQRLTRRTRGAGG